MAQRVLIAVDFSPASAQALAVARQHFPQATRRLLQVLRPSDVAANSAAGAAHTGTSPLSSKDMRESAEKEAMEQLEAWAQEGEECGIDVGNAAEEIMRQAEEWGADMIVLGTRGRSQLANMLHGSATEWLIRHARQPVVVVHEVSMDDSIRAHLPPSEIAD
ncbi:universal stress protein UspA [Thiohalorhabdus denitrificans]|uniref:Nucleotide-binding universal stress protein, UspA family n=1 Tax=Thiohalorhabdus denitrificans TaxID=381306 RepID=A0A0P9C7X3_9GAMM|nr:universal stress protein [Thiohalorhabdus denitrificans]KPV41296.1 universal stress protein UspA [Thiohalorhabdus denitrificans]SCY22089.1 Nucleotide-binding universal stress protein, UspA family [Thiohalorhabdus denitrificans]